MSYVLPIERGKIREFAAATQSKNEAYAGPEPVIPATFLTIARLAWEPKDQNPMLALAERWDMRRVLHGEEEYVFHGPLPRAGQTLHVETRLDAEWEKVGKRGGVMKFARVVNEFRDDSGRLVAEQRTTAVCTAYAPKGQT